MARSTTGADGPSPRLLNGLGRCVLPSHDRASVHADDLASDVTDEGERAQIASIHQPTEKVGSPSKRRSRIIPDGKDAGPDVSRAGIDQRADLRRH